MNLCGVIVERVNPDEEGRFQDLMEKHHYLGALPKISETIVYAAIWRDQWLVISGVLAAIRQKLLRPKKVGPLPVEGSDEVKPVPLLEAIDINGKDIASDALLTQTSIGGYSVRNHGHYHFTV